MTREVTGPPEERTLTLARALAAAEHLLEVPGRRILGIAGPPGAGKSTLAARLAEAVDARRGAGTAIAIGMDGFHLDDPELARLDRLEQKGAPDTFDADGLTALLERLRAPHPQRPVYASRFDRDRELSIGSAVPVGPAVRLVILEGNWLLETQEPWPAVRPLLDAAWYLDVPEAELRRRLLARRISHGHPAQEATEWVERVDMANAATARRTREQADIIWKELS